MRSGLPPAGSPPGTDPPPLPAVCTAATAAGDRTCAAAAGFEDMRGASAESWGHISYGGQRVFRWVRPAPAPPALPAKVANVTLWQLAGGGGGLRLTVRRGPTSQAPSSNALADTAIVFGGPGDIGPRAATVMVRLGGAAVGAGAARWVWVEGLSSLLDSVPFRLVVDPGPTGPCALPVLPAGGPDVVPSSTAALGTGTRLSGLLGPVPAGYRLVVRAGVTVDPAAGVCRHGDGPPGTTQACAYAPPPPWNGSAGAAEGACGGCLMLRGWELVGLAAQAASAAPLVVEKRSMVETVVSVRSCEYFARLSRVALKAA